MPPETRRCYSRTRSRCQSRIPQELQAESKSPNAWCPLPSFGNSYALPGSCLNAAKQRLVDFSTQSTTFRCQMSILTPLLLSPSLVANCFSVQTTKPAAQPTVPSTTEARGHPSRSCVDMDGKVLDRSWEQRPLRGDLRRAAGCEVSAATDRRPRPTPRL